MEDKYIPKQKIPEKSAEQELSAEQRRLLAEVWSKMVLGTEEDLYFGQDSKEEIKEKLWQSLRTEISKIVDEWGLGEGFEKIADEIKEETDLSKRKELELSVLEKIKEKFIEYKKNFRSENEVSRKWESWPLLMRETGEFNCVGATLLGNQLLDKLGIKSRLGNPVGHVVNLVELSDGGLVYLDLQNGVVKKIQAEKIEIAGMPTLKLNDKQIEYRIIALVEQADSPMFIINNLHALNHEAQDKELSDKNIGKQEAIRFRNRFLEIIKQINFDLPSILYGDKLKYHDSPEMKAEEERINILFSFDQLATDYLKSFSIETQDKLLGEAKKKINNIIDYLTNNDNMALNGLSKQLKKYFELYKTGFDEFRQKHAEEASEQLDRMIGKLKA